MEWFFEDDYCVKHTDGHSIVLRSGEWHNPTLVIPKLIAIDDPKIGSQLIREGLRFAKINALEGDAFVA